MSVYILVFVSLGASNSAFDCLKRLLTDIANYECVM